MVVMSVVEAANLKVTMEEVAAVVDKKKFATLAEMSDMVVVETTTSVVEEDMVRIVMT